MECAKDYQAVVSADGKLAFIIPAGKSEPHSPKLIYNGGESALLYRSAAQTFWFWTNCTRKRKRRSDGNGRS